MNQACETYPCRFCLSEQSAQVLIDLFSEVNNPNLKDIVDKYFPVEISADDELPKSICQLCFARCITVKEFFDNVLNAEAEMKRRQERIKKENLLKDPLEKLTRLGIRLQKVVKQDSLQIITQQPIIINAAPTTTTATVQVQNALTRLSATGVTLKKMRPSIENGTTAIEPSVAPVIRTYSRAATKVLPTSPSRTELKRKAKESPAKIKTEIASPEDDDPKDTDYSPNPVKETTPKKRRIVTKVVDLHSPTTKTVNNETFVVNVNPGPVYVCTNCRSRFNTFEELKTHMRESIMCKYANTTCNVCGKIYESRKQLYSHSQRHKIASNHCPECGKTYSSKYSLENHRASVHGVEMEEVEGLQYQCRICSESFKTRKELFPHVFSHTNEQVERLCEVCGKQCDSEEQLRSHTRTHSDSRPFECDFPNCGKKFRKRLLLIEHQHIHTGIKTFKCDQCKMSFAKKCSLVNHERQKHTQIMPYQCSRCDMKFATCNRLRNHIKICQHEPVASTTSEAQVNSSEEGAAELEPLQNPEASSQVATTSSESSSNYRTVTLSFTDL